MKIVHTFFILVIVNFCICKVVSKPAILADNGACPFPSLLSYSKQFCDYYVDNPMDFINAEGYCTKLGGHLISIRGIFDDMDVSVKARKKFPDFMKFATGGNRLLDPNTWTWIDDGLRITDFDDWAPNEPLNNAGRNCLHVDIARGQWYAADCYAEYPFICRVPISSATTTAAVVPTTTPSTDPTTTPSTDPTTTPPSKSCANVIFIGEMTEIIGQQRKESFLNATKMIAEHLNSIFKDVNYAIATFGNDIYRSIQLQSFSSFHSDLLKIINNVTVDNFPNGQQTFVGSTLKQLVAVLSSNNPRNSLVLFMGQTQQILDLSRGDEIAKSIAVLKSEVYVLDATSGNFTNDYIFKDLVGGQQSKLANLTIDWKPEDITKFYSSIFQTFIRNVTCN